MSAGNIEAMKEDGAAGQDIINKLIENSQTFSMKTQFSKDKWLKKKAQKYLVTFEVREPNSLEICEAYFHCYPDRICYLRPDMLGFMMQMANISSESKVLMVENTRGFLPGVMIEKQIKYGLRVEFCTRSLKHVTDILVEMDHPASSHSKIGCINSNLLMDGSKDPLQPAFK
jgi:tRNA (adenine-N(1)-)-methyltransferase non-catalytic subunit